MTSETAEPPRLRPNSGDADDLFAAPAVEPVPVAGGPVLAQMAVFDDEDLGSAAVQQSTM